MHEEKRSRGRPRKAETSPTTSIRIPVDVRRAVEWDMAEREEKSLTEWILRAIDERLRRHRP